MSHNTGVPLMKEVMKHRSHPRIIAIKENFNSGLSFSFSQVQRDDIMKEINKLKTNKPAQSTEIPVKLVKEIFSDTFGDTFF